MAPRPELEAEHLREKARKEFLNLLEGVRGKKNIVLSKSLTGPLGLFVKGSTLKEYGVDKIFVLENGNTDSSQRNVVYIVNGEKASQVQATAEQVKKLQHNGPTEHEITIIWVPRRTLVSNKILEDEGILGDVNVTEFSLSFSALEDDVLSLELEDSFQELFLRKDPTSISLAARALMQVQHRHGFFPRILGKGDNARKLANLLLRGRKEIDAEETSALQGIVPSTTIESLIIFDRDVDLATPLLSQLTYEGLIDELVGIQYNQADVESSIVGGTQAAATSQTSSSSASAPHTSRQSLKRKIQLDSSDTLYSQLRGANFSVVGPILNKVARRLESDYEAKNTAKTATELKDFVNKLPTYQAEHQSLRIHTNLAEDLMKHTRDETFSRELEVQQNVAAGTDPTYQHEAIEELIARDLPLPNILRLLCLESTVAGGMRPRDLDNFKRQIVQAYGYQHILTLDALEKMELLQSRSTSTALLLPAGGASGGTGSKTNYVYLRKELRLIFDDVNESDPNDVAYVYSGYAPLSIRIIQCILQKSYLQLLYRTPLPLTSSSTGWQGFEDILNSAKGPTFNIVQKAHDEKAGKVRTQLAGTAGWKTVFIFFLGGITFTEIAALRFIGKQLEAAGERKRLMICTTGIISGRSIVEGVIEKASFATQ